MGLRICELWVRLCVISSIIILSYTRSEALNASKWFLSSLAFCCWHRIEDDNGKNCVFLVNEKKNQFPLHARTTAPNVSIHVCSHFHIEVSTVTFYICNDCQNACGGYIFVMIFDPASFPLVVPFSLLLSLDTKIEKNESKRCEIIRRFTDDIYLHGTNYQCQSKTYRFTKIHSVRHNKPSSSSDSDNRDAKKNARNRNTHFISSIFFCSLDCWNWCIHFMQFVRWQLAVTIKQTKHFADAICQTTEHISREKMCRVLSFIDFWSNGGLLLLPLV